MRIKADQLAAHLNKQLAPLYTVFGGEPLLVAETTDHIRNTAHKQGCCEHETFVADTHFRWSDLLSAGGTQSLFGDRKLIDLRIPTGKPGRDGGKAIEAYCQAIPEDAVTLITLPKIDKSSQSTKWFKALEKTGVMIAVYPVEPAQLPAWIKTRLARQQQTTDRDTLVFIAQQVEGNLLAANQEIQKLGLLHPQGHLTFEQVKNAILDVARYDVFQLADAMVSANTARYVRILHGLQSEGVAPPLILAVLCDQIRKLIFLRQGLRKGLQPGQLLKTARIWGDKQQGFIRAAQRIQLNRLLQSLLHAAAIDRIVKGVAGNNTTDPWPELLRLGLELVAE